MNNNTLHQLQIVEIEKRRKYDVLANDMNKIVRPGQLLLFSLEMARFHSNYYTRSNRQDQFLHPIYHFQVSIFYDYRREGKIETQKKNEIIRKEMEGETPEMMVAERKLE